jgi:hypothetical protein
MQGLMQRGMAPLSWMNAGSTVSRLRRVFIGIYLNHFIDKACRCRKVAFLSGHMLSDDLLALLAKTKVKFFQKPLDIVSFNEWLM